MQEKPSKSKPRAIQKKPPPAVTPVVNASGSLAKLKGLSLRQPWAEMVMRGDKTWEYRQTAVNFRGRIYIYASLGRYSKLEEEEIALEVGYEIEDLARGVVVGTVEICDCSDNGDGTFTWELENAERLDAPVAPHEKPQPVWFHPFGRQNA